MSSEWRTLDPARKGILRRKQDRAPVKLSSIAEELGLKLRAATLPAGISGEIRPDPAAPAGYVIRVNRHDSPGRQRFTIAHEISHYLLHEQFIGDGITDDILYRSGISDWKEAQANRLAADILMPEALVAAWLDRARALGVQDLTNYLAEKFEVSEGAMRIRLGLA